MNRMKIMVVDDNTVNLATIEQELSDRYDIIPMLQEYWFDDSKKLQKWEKELSGVFNDY